jgi:hypothetical protein
MTVPQIEERLTELAENDIQNPEIYELLKQLASICIFQNKYVYGYSDIESVCHDAAADTYMRILNGRTKITKWMYYIERSIQLSYIPNQKKLEHEIINTRPQPNVKKSKPIIEEDAVINMSAGSAFSISNDFNKVKKMVFLKNIDSLIREVLGTTKFKKHSKEWLALYTSVTLSLYYNSLIYFRLPTEMKPYVKLTITLFKKALLNSELFEDEFEDADNDLPSLVFYDEQLYKEADRRRDV